MIRKIKVIKNHGYESQSMLWKQFRNKLRCIISMLMCRIVQLTNFNSLRSKICVSLSSAVRDCFTDICDILRLWRDNSTGLLWQLRCQNLGLITTYKFQRVTSCDLQVIRLCTSFLKFKSHNKCRLVIKGRQGFTLLEIMVALVLIAIVIVSVIQLSSANLRNLATTNDQIDALIYANSKMREILDLDKIEDKSWNETDDNGYSYEITIVENWKERTDSLAVKMEEITLATSWVTGNKKKQIVLKTAKMVSKLDTINNANNPSTSSF
jgi:prepilin-type N-terminal cleavage/methylation domain-containing protein